MSELPPHWRQAALDMIRGVSPPDGAMFRGGPWSSPAEQIGVYAEQYVLRMGDVLRDDLVGLCHLLGDDADATLRAYLVDHPPDTWTLARLIDRLPDWLATQDVAPELVEMARLDHLVQVGFTAATGTTPTPDVLQQALAAGAPLRLQPHVQLLVVHHDVHLVRADLTSGDAPRPLSATTHHLALFRAVDLRMRHLDMVPAAFAILQTFAGAGAPVDQAVDAAIAAAGDVDSVAANLQSWFGLFMERGLLELGTVP